MGRGIQEHLQDLDSRTGQTGNVLQDKMEDTRPRRGIQEHLQDLDSRTGQTGNVLQDKTEDTRPRRGTAPTPRTAGATT